MIIRSYKDSDLEGIVRVERESFPVGPYTRRMLKRVLELPQCFSFVAEENSEIVGYVAAIPLGGEAADVESIAVIPSFQKKGVGATLLDRIEEAMRERGFHQSILEVREKNESALAFYRNHGYQVTSHMPRYYREVYEGSRGAYRMSKNLI